ncbi:MAG: PTS sugar transporter subunit IIA [Planctomycetaceae bacterium]|jgi:nitrogen PTS system EIIA component|nr:PTS sugar transporter subunit IIA [Planctomycetaceae bacterium]
MTEQEMTLAELAKYLHLDVTKIERLLKQEKIPARRVGGEWSFNLHEINRWMEHQIGVADAEELEKMEISLHRHAGSSPNPEAIIQTLLPEHHIIKPLPARTKGSVIREICDQAMQLGLVWDASKMAELIGQREEMHSTALDNGMALLHPRRPQPGLIGDPFLILGVTSQGIPFGGPRGMMTDVFVLIGSREDSGHLQTLARLSRIIQVPEALIAIRELPTPGAIWDELLKIESQL